MLTHSDKDNLDTPQIEQSSPATPVKELTTTLPSKEGSTREPDLPAPSSPRASGEERSPHREEKAPLLASQEESISAPTRETTLTLDQNGQFCSNWWESHDSLKELGKTLKKFKSPEALARSYAELEKIRSYPDPQDEEKMQRIRSFLGLPANKAEYKITAPTIEEGQESCWDDALASRMAETAYQYAIPPVAMQALAEAFTKEQVQYQEQLKEQNEKQAWEVREQTLSELKELWGPRCQAKLESASHTLNQLCNECGLDPSFLGEDPAIGSHPGVIRLLDHISGLLGEPPLKGAQTSGSSQAIEDMRRMEKDPGHPLHEAYMNYKHPNHEYANSLYDKVMFKESH